GPGAAVPALVAPGADVAVDRSPDPRRGAAARAAGARARQPAEPGMTDEPIAGAPGALLVIVSGPSGVGKDTVISSLCLIPTQPERYFVITCTTRPRRDYEVDGVHYHFMSDEAFTQKRDAGGFLEANLVHGHWYGTPRDQVRMALAAGRDAILKIDVQGA